MSHLPQSRPFKRNDVWQNTPKGYWRVLSPFLRQSLQVSYSSTKTASHHGCFIFEPPNKQGVLPLFTICCQLCMSSTKKSSRNDPSKSKKKFTSPTFASTVSPLQHGAQQVSSLDSFLGYLLDSDCFSFGRCWKKPVWQAPLGGALFGICNSIYVSRTASRDSLSKVTYRLEVPVRVLEELLKSSH